MQAAAGVDECFGAARAGALREQIRRSKAASACSLQGADAEKAVDACEEAVHDDNASASAPGDGDAAATGTASAASTVGAERSDLTAEGRGESPFAGEPESVLDLACFKTRAAGMAPDPGRTDCRLLEPLPVDTAKILYDIPGAQIGQLDGTFLCNAAVVYGTWGIRAL